MSSSRSGTWCPSAMASFSARCRIACTTPAAWVEVLLPAWTALATVRMWPGVRSTRRWLPMVGMIQALTAEA